MARGKKTGGGSRKGVPNKATTDVRAAIALFAQKNAAKFEQWISRTSRKDPAKAADLYLRAIEYHIPKLQRTEVTGLDGGALSVELSSKDEKL
ncbi:MAG: hypothetical protein RLZZ200_529 [Pseudomonadota bacterium]|jgi:hypothetical protein